MPADRRDSRLRPRLVALACGVAAALAVAEVALRCFWPQDTMARIEANNPAMYQPSDVLPYELRPGYRGRLVRREFATSIAIDGDGYRGPELAAATAADHLRVLVVGDSFTFGWGVEEEQSYPRVAERLLRAALGADVEVINAGFAACYYPDTYYLYLRTRGLALDPDLVVVGLFAGNDLDHARAYENRWEEVDADGLPLRIVNLDSMVDAGYWVRRRRSRRYQVPVLRDAHLFQLVYGAAARLRARLAGLSASDANAASDGAAAGGPTASSAGKAMAIPPSFRRRYSPETEARTARVLHLLRATHRLLADHGVPMVALVIPDRHQILPPGASDPRADWERPQRILGELFATEGIVWIDLLDQVRAAARERELYFPADSHFNAAGQELAGRRLAERLLGPDLLAGRR